jgi:hypothetical protein
MYEEASGEKDAEAVAIERLRDAFVVRVASISLVEKSKTACSLLDPRIGSGAKTKEL